MVFKRIGTNSLQGHVVNAFNIKPNHAVARYLELTAADMEAETEAGEGKRSVSRVQFPTVTVMANPTTTWGRVYLLQFHPKTGRAPIVVDAIAGQNLFADVAPITETQASGEYVVRVYELNGQTAL